MAIAAYTNVSTRAWARAGVVLWAALSSGCGIGAGTGEAAGTLFVASCRSSGDLGSVEAPAPYSLKPEFFAGEPIADIGGGRIKANRLIIRMQSTGRRAELNDVLYFDVTNSFEVARCVRGRTPTGGPKPDYDARNCSWAAGTPRLRVAPDAFVSAFLTPRVTCPTTNVVGTAVATRPDAMGMPVAASPDTWESWINLLEFGSAVAPRSDLPAEQRSVTAPDFRVDFGGRLHVQKFRLLLKDDTFVRAPARGDARMPTSELEATLEGFFDFDLERGQSAQTFP